MFQKLLNSNLLRGSKALGVDLYINSDGSFDIACMVLSKQKNKILIENKYTGLKQISEIQDKALKGLPVCLSIDGKGVLLKRVEKSGKQKLIQQILPNAKEDDFYLQGIDSDENYRFIGAIRKEILESFIEAFNKIDVFITKLYLGPLALNNIIEIIGVKDFYTKHYQLTSGENEIHSIEKISESKQIIYKIGDEELYSDDLHTYTLGLSFFIDSATRWMPLCSDIVPINIM